MNAEPDSGIEITCDNTQSAGRLINCARLESVESARILLATKQRILAPMKFI